MKKLLPALFLFICLGVQAYAQQQGADVNELGRFIGKTVQISGVLGSILPPNQHHPNAIVVVNDDMVSGISVKVVLRRANFSKTYYKSLDSAKGQEVFINAKIKKANGKLVGINYERDPDIEIVIPIASDGGGDPNNTHVVIKIGDAAKYKGKYVQLTDTVRDYTIVKDSIYLDLGRKHPDETVIVAGSRHEIPGPDDLVGKVITINGVLTLYQQKLMIKERNIFVQ
jgi:hypothetical protein